MKPEPMTSRILGALALQPMTAHQLSVCLGGSISETRRKVRLLCWTRKLRRLTTTPGHGGRPWVVYSRADAMTAAILPPYKRSYA